MKKHKATIWVENEGVHIHLPEAFGKSLFGKTFRVTLWSATSKGKGVIVMKEPRRRKKYGDYQSK